MSPFLEDHISEPKKFNICHLTVQTVALTAQDDCKVKGEFRLRREETPQIRRMLQKRRNSGAPVWFSRLSS